MILLLGSNGYVGKEFYKQLFQKGIPTRTHIPSRDITYTQLQLLHKSLKLTAIINCAGYTGKPNVDACETNKNEICISVLFSRCLKICLRQMA